MQFFMIFRVERAPFYKERKHKFFQGELTKIFFFLTFLKFLVLMKVWNFSGMIVHIYIDIVPSIQ